MAKPVLVDFFNPDAFAGQVIDVLQNPDKYQRLGPEARKHVVRNYDFLTKCLPEHIAQINALVPADKQISLP